MKKLRSFQKLSTPGWKTVPDCPDLKGEFQVDIDFNTLEYSWELLLKFYDPGNPHHLPVIQGYYNNPESYRNYCKRFIKEFGKPNKVAVGTVCKSDNIFLTEEIAIMTRKYFPDAWIHFFGLKLHHLRRSWMYINSYDSCSWTWPRNNKSGNNRRPQATNKSTKIQYFNEYVEQIQKYCDLSQTKLVTIEVDQ